MRIYRIHESSGSSDRSGSRYITLFGEMKPENITRIDDEPLDPHMLVEIPLPRNGKEWRYNTKKGESKYHLVLCENLPNFLSIEGAGRHDFEKDLYSNVIDSPQFQSLVKEYLYEFLFSKKIALLRKYSKEFSEDIRNDFIRNVKSHDKFNLKYIQEDDAFSLIESIFYGNNTIEYCQDIDFETLTFMRGLYSCILIYNTMYVSSY